jgi:hypothetical protein
MPIEDRKAPTGCLGPRRQEDRRLCTAMCISFRVGMEMLISRVVVFALSFQQSRRIEATRALVPV